MIRDYIKITEQDLKLAEDFFENDKHFNEWLVNVVRYYRGNKVEIKTKIVQKYFNNYKKTMDFIIVSVKGGKKSAELRTDKQEVIEDTLPTPLVTPLPSTLPTNIKDKIEKNKYKAFIVWFNDLMGKKYKGDKTSEGQFNARIKEGYVFDNFKNSLLAIREDKFHKENNYKYITPEFLTRSAQLEKWSNFKVEVTPNYSQYDGIL